MSNSYYNNDTNTIVDFTVAQASDVENKCDDVADGFTLVDADIVALNTLNGKALRHSTDDLDAMTANAATRANKVVGFDSVGDVALKTIAAQAWLQADVTPISSAATVDLATTYYVSGGSYTLTLPAPVNLGDWVWFLTDDQCEATPVTLDGDSLQVEGYDLLSIDANYKSFRVVYDGSSWRLA